MDEQISKPLSAIEVFEKAGKTCKLVSYEELLNSETINKLFQKANDQFYNLMPNNLPYDPNAVLILYKSEPLFGHWVLLTKNENGYHYLDSYGEPIDNPLDYVPKKFKHKKWLAKLLLDSGENVFYNHNKLQKLSDNISTCGRYCSIFLKYSNMNVDDLSNMIIKAAKKNNISCDKVVTLLTEN